MQNVFKILLYTGFLISTLVNAQENDINLNFLFDKWIILQDGSSDKDLVAKKSNAYSIHSYDFKIGMDSIIYQNKILEKRMVYCGIPFQRSSKGYELWTLEAQEAMLRYDIYFDSIVSKKPADYSIIYKIVSLNKRYLKLRLEKELFEGEE